MTEPVENEQGRAPPPEEPWRDTPYFVALVASMAVVLVQVSKGRIDTETALAAIVSALSTLSLFARRRIGRDS